MYFFLNKGAELIAKYLYEDFESYQLGPSGAFIGGSFNDPSFYIYSDFENETVGPINLITAIPNKENVTTSLGYTSDKTQRIFLDFEAESIGSTTTVSSADAYNATASPLKITYYA